MKTKNSKVLNKSSDLTPISYECFGNSLNLARIKFISWFICSLCKVQTVGFEKIASGLENNCDTDSSLRRIQRFMAEYALDTNLIAKFIFAKIPKTFCFMQRTKNI